MTSELSCRVLQTVGEKLLKEIEKEATDEGEVKVSDENLLALYSVFGEVAERALQLLESQRICLIQVEGKSRYFFKVIGKGTAPSYILFPDVNFCQCPAYKYQVINSSMYITCKHVLAVRLAKILRKYRTDSITPQQYADVVMSEISVHFPGVLS